MSSSVIPKFFRSMSSNVRKSHTVNKVVKTSPHHLYSVVTDVNAYQQFLPFCKSSRILRRSPCESQFDASLKVGISDFPPLNVIEEEYISRVKHFERKGENGKQEWIVEANSIRSNLFYDLKSSWILSEIEKPIESIIKEGTNTSNSPATWTKVEFKVEMTVADPIIIAALDQVLKGVAIQQVDAFEKRCFDTSLNVGKR